ncbi:MAG: hypothetical protein R3213_10990 [Flavobacteriaceae bacterium]|nr:hypothetical protein [Flavobacteriaceae bacterium]
MAKVIKLYEAPTASKIEEEINKLEEEGYQNFSIIQSYEKTSKEDIKKMKEQNPQSVPQPYMQVLLLVGAGKKTMRKTTKKAKK